MPLTVKDAVESFDYDDLLKLKYDLEKGAVHFRKLVNTKIKEMENQHKSYCAVCGNEIDPNSHENYTIVFGPHDFRKKASFDALDCMNFFVENLKKQKKIVN